MSKPLILSNSTSIHGQIKAMFSTRTRGKRRVILVAYVGKEAPQLLPDARGVEIYCWPQPGATHPDAVRALLKAGAKVFFVPGLHMKLYWVEGVGALIGSANLSRNGMGVGGLHEAGVFLSDPAGLDIDHLIQGLNAAPATQAAINLLQRDHDDTSERQRQTSSPATKTPTLLDWFDQPMRRPWKLGWFDGKSVSPSQPARDQSLREYHVTQPHWWQDCKESDYERSDWALVFELSKDKPGPTQFQWRFIHFIAPPPEKDDAYNEDYPFQAVQAVPIHKGTTPPFRLDAPTKAALSAAVGRYGGAAIRKLAVPRPSAKFLGILREEALSHLAEPK